MKAHLLTAAILTALGLSTGENLCAQSFEIILPDESPETLVETQAQTQIEILDPDASVYTLGKPEIIFDFTAGQDSLLDLQIRRSGLRFDDGSPFTAFASHKDHNLVVIAKGDVAHVRITGVSDSFNAREALVLFSRADGTLISPPREHIAVFDTGLKPLSFAYTPLAVPSRTAHLPVNILLDVSGSMTGFTQDMVSATQDFLGVLPGFARCRLFAFNESVQELTFGQAQACPQTTTALDRLPNPSGSTQLFRAVTDVLKRPPKQSGTDLKPVTLVITDGVDTSGSDLSAHLASAMKLVGNTHLFVFWAGQADPGALARMADLQVTPTARGKEDLRADLARFYTDLGLTLTGMQVLRIER